MASEPKTFWRGCRRVFRWCRIFVLLCVLGFVAFVLYLNQVGVPAFVQEPIERELRLRGLDVQLGACACGVFMNCSPETSDSDRLAKQTDPAS